MNGYLLDTHAFLWTIFEPEKLGTTAQLILSKSTSNIYVSSVTFWEIALKASVGKLTLIGCTPEDLPSIADQLGYRRMGLETEEAASFHCLPKHNHKDPFDRMLIWQAIQRQLILISKDGAFPAYESLGLRMIW
ncbi:MAG: type II toxin-antitoxin system VapC family toxin [Methylococcales bacterium]